MNDNGAWTDRRDDLYASVVRRGRARKVRRWSLGGAGIVIVAAVVALGVAAANTGGEHSVRVQHPDGPTTTVPNARPAGVLLIGDSVMQDARAQLETLIPGARVDAEATRTLDDAVALLETARDRRSLPRSVVVQLGTSGDSDQVFETVTNIMDTIGPASTVYFLTVNGDSSMTGMNTALYDGVGRWPNAHVLDWHHFSSGRLWFAPDGVHLVDDGPAQYAQFIRDGIQPEPTTYTDPFHDAIVPASGLYVTSDPKYGGPEETSTSYAVRIVDESSGAELGALPRASIDSQVSNVARKQLVVTDDGIRLDAVPLANVAGVPEGCTQTEANGALAVALCGSYGGPNLLSGDRVIVNRGEGWQDLIAKPPAPDGVTVGGHWYWASPSPDGQWVLAAWSGECEVSTSLFVRVADGAVHTVTGEPNLDGPQSGGFGWTTSGDALAVFGESDTGCGTAAAVPRGVYEVSPTTGARFLVLPLAPDENAIRWTAVDDRRTRRAAPGSPVSVDLDGNGRADPLSVEREVPTGVGPVLLTAPLALEDVVVGRLPSAYAVRVLGTTDIAPGGRQAAVLAVGGETWTLGAVVVLDGRTLVAITDTPEGNPIGWGAHSNGDPNGTADVACRTVDGRLSLVVAHSTVEPDGRHWERSVYRLDRARLVRQAHDSGVIATGVPAPPDVPLANRLVCGSARD